MKFALLFLLALLGLPFQAAHAACVQVNPFESLGELEIGQKAPQDYVGAFKVHGEEGRAGLRHFVPGPYRFEVDENQRIQRIQFDPTDSNYCLVVRSKRLKPFKDLYSVSKEFPECQFTMNFGGDELVCDGFSFYFAEKRKFGTPAALRIDVEAASLVKRNSDRAADNALRAVAGEWPYLPQMPLKSKKISSKN